MWRYKVYGSAKRTARNALQQHKQQGRHKMKTYVLKLPRDYAYDVEVAVRDLLKSKGIQFLELFPNKEGDCWGAFFEDEYSVAEVRLRFN